MSDDLVRSPPPPLPRTVLANSILDVLVPKARPSEESENFFGVASTRATACSASVDLSISCTDGLVSLGVGSDTGSELWVRLRLVPARLLGKEVVQVVLDRLHKVQGLKGSHWMK